MEAHFGQHPDAEIYRQPARPGRRSSAPGCWPSSATTQDRYADAKARKNYAGTSPITRQSGKKKVVLARYVHNDRLIDALGRQAFAALTRLTRRPRLLRPAPRPRHRATDAALRQLANRLVGILHGCLKTGTLYDETTAWPPPNKINRFPGRGVEPPN